MSSDHSRPSGCTPFEQELVNAMNDFVNTAETPHFDTAVIARGARRKRTTALTGVVTALIVAGAGTALAVGNTSHSARPTTAATATADSTTVLVRTSDGKTVSVPLAGLNSTGVRRVLVPLRITPSFTRARVAGCRPTMVVAVSPHAPTVVRPGDTVSLTTCEG
ncbi:hypothetical protein OG599_34450 [Streptomyces sp. NBC_01335]|uniref:hypothetical protein n=1 Tax=Streptomyces sp. NBC_01335 TaxID=2903828 RepID=UPI002E116D0E|nr:hypothetical protein OG599_34450 [Streptomyces sp. NBC_01335]